MEKCLYNCAVLVGAGASIKHPSNLPSFNSLQENILIELNKHFNSMMKDHISNYIKTKPELLLSTIWHYFNNKINPISGFELADYNTNHYLIAQLCKYGLKLVITTNFDCCIEKALDDCNLDYVIFTRSPQNEQDEIELTKIINSNKILLWKPHGDAKDINSLCYTIERVSLLNNSKHLKSIYSLILEKYDLYTFGYSGYDDDLFPILYDYPKSASKINKLIWNSYSQEIKDTPPAILKSKWKKQMDIVYGDMHNCLMNIIKSFGINPLIKTRENAYSYSLKSLIVELNKISSDDCAAILGQYYNGMNNIYSKLYWQLGLGLPKLKEYNKYRFRLNLVENDLETIYDIFNESYSKQYFDVANVALTRMIYQNFQTNNLASLKKLLKIFREKCMMHPDYFDISKYYLFCGDYLIEKYGESKRMFDRKYKFSQRAYDILVTRGDLLSAINIKIEQLSTIALSNYSSPEHLAELLKYSNMLEAYNRPIDLAQIYSTIANVGIRLHNKDIADLYASKSLEKLEYCYEANIYNKEKYIELKSVILHQKAMSCKFAKEVIDMTKIAIDCLKSLECINPNNTSLKYYGVYYDTICKNYIALEEYYMAKTYAEKALYYHRLYLDKRGEARTLLDYGTILNKTGEVNEAKKHFLKSYNLLSYIGENLKILYSELEDNNLSIDDVRSI